MKKQTRKWAAALLAVGCASICIGAGVAAHTYSAADVTAAAENPYNLHEIGALTVHVNSSTGAACTLSDALYLKRADGKAFPILSWDYAFAAENENCFKVNGKPAALEVMKSTGDGMYFKFSALQPGDIVTVSGTYVCDSQATSYAITESSFKWGGSGWSDYVYIEYTEFNVGSLDYSHGDAKQLYFKPTNSEIVLPINNWDDAFSYGSGNGITVDGEMISMINSVKSPDGMFFADLGKNASVGSVLKIGGTLNCDKQQIAYVIEDCEFIWNGTTWVKQGAETPENPESSESSEDIESSEAPIEYTTYNVNVLDGANNCSATAVYAWVVEGDALNINSWDHAFVLEADSGAGMLLNGVALAGWELKQPGADLYIGLGATAVAGDVLTIDGTFYNEDKAAKIVFNNCQLQFNGTMWVTNGETPENPDDPDSSENIESSETPVEPTTYVINKLGYVANGSSASAVFAWVVEGDALGVNSWDHAFSLQDGDGLYLNDQMLSGWEIKQPGADLYIALGATAVAGDVLTINGTFYNEDKEATIIFNNCKLQYDGTTWETYREPVLYTYYELGQMIIDADSSTNSAIYIARADGGELPVHSWDYEFKFVYDSGCGLVFNGEAFTTKDVKSPGDKMYIGLGEHTAKEGDVMTVGGTFCNDDAAVAYVIEESTFVYINNVWMNQLDVIKAEYKAVLDEYKKNFAEENYYEAEWNSFDTIIADAKLAIDLAASEAEFSEIVEKAKKAMDDVVTKEEADEIFEDLKVSAKADLDGYKSEADYEAEDWQTILAIVAAAKTEIDGATSVTSINTSVNNAKTQIDAVKTAVEKEADEAVVAGAKAELAAYKNESDYKAAQWAEIQAILEKANVELDGAIGNESVIAEIVTETKAKLDEVKTATEQDAIEGVVAAAKAELAAYKNESDYKAEQWAEMQAILANAGADLDKAIGNESEIANIVTKAKAAMDKVLTATQADAAALEAAKEAGKEEALSYYATIDLDLYSDEAAAEISGYVAAAIAAIESATTADAVAAAVAQLKTNVGGVAKLAGTNEGKSSGCGSVVTGGLAALLAVGVAMVFKKKED